MAVGTDARSTFLAIVKGDASQAVTEFKKLGSSVEKSTKGAEGSVGKFQKFTSGAMSELKANAGIMAAGAGAAIGAFAIASVNKFADLGVAIGKFSDATGVATEDASRWVEVAGDIGIEMGTVEKALGRLNRSIDEQKFAELGIEIARTKDGATDVSETFLNVIDRLNGMKDPAEKARVAQQLLGRGWQEMAELINQGSGSLRKSLADVSDAKVFDQREVQRARDVRAAMDKLRDVVDDLALTIGNELAPAFADFVDTVSDLAGPLSTAYSWLVKINSYNPLNLPAWAERLYDVATSSQQASDKLYLLSASFEDVAGFISEHNITGQDALDIWARWNEIQPTAKRMAEDTAGAIGTLNDANKVNAQRMWEAEEAQRAVEQATKDMNDAYADLIGRIDESQAWEDLSVAMWELRDGLGDTGDEARDVKKKMADMVMEMDNIPTEKKTRLLTLIDRGALDTVYAELGKLQRYVITVPVKPVGAGGSLIGAGGKRANGGPVSAHVPYLVGERGPELIVPSANAMVMDASRTERALGSGGSPINLALYVRTLPTERELIDLVNGVRRKQGAVI